MAIIELLALCLPHYIQLLNDSRTAWGHAAVSNFEQFIICIIEAKAFYMQNSLFTYVTPIPHPCAHTYMFSFFHLVPYIIITRI